MDDTTKRLRAVGLLLCIVGGTVVAASLLSYSQPHQIPGTQLVSKESFAEGERAAFAQLHRLEVSLGRQLEPRADASDTDDFKFVSKQPHLSDAHLSRESHQTSNLRHNAAAARLVSSRQTTMRPTSPDRLHMLRARLQGYERPTTAAKGRVAPDRRTKTILGVSVTLSQVENNETSSETTSTNASSVTQPAHNSSTGYVSPASLGEAGAEAFHAFIEAHENYSIAAANAKKVSCSGVFSRTDVCSFYLHIQPVYVAFVSQHHTRDAHQMPLIDMI